MVYHLCIYGRHLFTIDSWVISFLGNLLSIVFSCTWQWISCSLVHVLRPMDNKRMQAYGSILMYQKQVDQWRNQLVSVLNTSLFRMLLHCLQLFNSASEIETTSNLWKHELASPAGTLASLCHRVVWVKNKSFKKNYSRYLTTGKIQVWPKPMYV